MSRSVVEINEVHTVEIESERRRKIISFKRKVRGSLQKGIFLEVSDRDTYA